MMENFRFLINTFGFIPNGNRTYFTSRSQPPFFAHLLSDVAEKEEALALSYTDALEKEYAFWMDEKKTISIAKGIVLNRYYDTINAPRPEAYLREIALLKEGIPPPELFRHIRAACASGWDFSSRWFVDPDHFTTIEALDILPIDLNCLLYGMERTLMRFFEKLAKVDKARYYADAAKRRKRAIRSLFMDEERGFFFDYRISENRRTDTWSLAGAFPLFEGIATESQAKSVCKVLEEKFLCPGGFQTTLRVSSHQWDAPNGWAPLQWTTIKGLLLYGYKTLAKKGALSWLDLCHKSYQQTGAMWEKYNVRTCAPDPVRGEYDIQEGFGWTNGVAMGLIDLFALTDY